MNELFNIITKDKIVFFSSVSSAILMVLTISLAVFFYNRLPDFIPLFNQMPWGEARLGMREQIFIPIVLSSGIIILNLLVGTLFYSKMPLILRILSVTAFTVSLFAFLLIMRTLYIMI